MADPGLVVIAPGSTVVTPLEFVHYPWSHSLLLAVVFGASLWEASSFQYGTEFAPGPGFAPIQVPEQQTPDGQFPNVTKTPNPEVPECMDRAEAKAGFSLVNDYLALQTSASARDAGPSASRVVDLTGRMGADGSIDWTPPKGNWRIIRLGWTLTGKTNHPAPAEATHAAAAGAARRVG